MEGGGSGQAVALETFAAPASHRWRGGQNKGSYGQQTSLAGTFCLQPALLLGSPSELPSLPCAPTEMRSPSHPLPWCSSITQAPSSLVFSLELCLRPAVHSFLGCGPQLCLSCYAFPSFSSCTFSLFTFHLSLSLFCFISTSLPFHLSLRGVCYLCFSPSLCPASPLSLGLPVSSISLSLCLSLSLL